MGVWPVLALGFGLGVRHALDPDHVVAVATLLSREKRPGAAARMGAMWGAGHLLTVLVVGTAILAFGLVLPPRVALALEVGVGLMLIGLGALNLFARANGAPPRTGARSFVVGVVHGLAGSAAIALMILATLTSVRLGIAYLGLFGIGTLAAMTAITSALSVPLSFARGARLRGALVRVAGVSCVVVGVIVIVRVVA